MFDEWRKHSKLLVMQLLWVLIHFSGSCSNANTHAGELLPTVIHVASRALAGQALSIHGDHSDTMLCRGCGLAFISSFSVQEAHDMAIISQVATLNSRVPFLHFMDGFRTSHEINKISLVSDDQLRDLMPWDKVDEHRQRALSPLHPHQRGTTQSPDVFMQLVESSNQYFNAAEGIVNQAFGDFYRVTGRRYRAFEYRYFGTTEPTVAIITMGSSVKVVENTLQYLKNEQTCMVGVRMFRPWSSKMFVDVLPKSIKRVAVLDRTREGGSQGEPLYLDVCTSLMREGRGNLFVAGGRYGLGSKDFTPRMVLAVIKNMLKKEESDIKRQFTVGIEDDVTHLSLPLGKPINTLDDRVTQSVFFGFGSDGTVGANKEAVKIIGNYHERYVDACMSSNCAEMLRITYRPVLLWLSLNSSYAVSDMLLYLHCSFFLPSIGSDRHVQHVGSSLH